MKLKIVNWNASSLSLVGRITLGQSILSVMPLYAMQTANILIGSCRDMEKAIRGFVWHSNEESRKMSLVAWSTILKPKADGGLCFQDLHLVNNAFGMKVCWELFTKPTSLWVRVLASKYKFDSEAGLNPIQPNSSSPLWRLVCKNWDHMMTNVAWIVENGQYVHFWEHKWLPGLDLPLIELVVSQVPDSMRFRAVASFVTALGEWDWLLIYEQKVWFFYSNLSLDAWLFRNIADMQCYQTDVSWGVVFGVVIWLLWKRQNRAVLGDDSQPAALTVEVVCCVGTQQVVKIVAAVRVEQGLPGTRREERLGLWLTPSAGVFKLNTDASPAADGMAAYDGGVLRDNHAIWKRPDFDTNSWRL
ncbi:hypothetical protein K2173_007225 [Erythroxylum novogranatense]|uniref:Uncharacterized protein n=1 Tax=Erythroxylum novogranatense TaxID=1862640 RepID=A0AAV8U8K2_9ROSI|nr:hypothetical protein K2173_007225 [Erythroxylum novogranatense]